MSAITDLFPRTRAEILRLLFSNGNLEIHLRDLARLAGMSPAALQKELTHLTNKEFVLMRRDGNRVYYRANAAHPLFAELCGIALKTTGIAAELSRSLSNVDGIVCAWIFGSVAAQTATSQSDVDLLVLGSVGLRKLTPALRGVAQALGREINPVCMSVTEWLEKKRRGDAFVTRVANEPKLWLKGGADELATMA
jgi:predicted nucleotidyltransferase